MLFLLGAQGIKSYADFIAKVDTAKKDTEQRLENAKKEGDSLMGEYEKLRAQLDEVRTLSGEVEKLSDKVENIENEIGIEQTGNLTPELKKDLESSFSTFIRYLERLGYKHKGGRVRVQVMEEADDNAYYVSNQNLIQIGPALSGDKQVTYHTYTIYALSSINEKAANNILLQSTVSGLADYFACSFSNNPRLGEISAKEINKRKGTDIYKEGYFRNLENNLNFENINNMNPVQAGEIWGGAFWEIRQLYGQEKADKLLFSAWSAMKNLDTDKTDGSIKFVNKLIEINKSTNGNEQSEQLRSIFERRGFKF